MSKSVDKSMIESDISYIKKSHEIVFSQLDLTPIEYDILALMLSRLNFEKSSDYFTNRDGKIVYTGKSVEFTFNAGELKEWFGIESSKFKNVLYNPCLRLTSKNIGLKSKNGFDFISLFKRIKYEDGSLTIIPNELLLPAYFGGSLGYSKVSSVEFRKLKRDTSKKLYMMLSRFKDSGSGRIGPIELNDLYGLFGMLNEKGELKKSLYSRFSVFAKRVISPAIKEIESIDSNIRFFFSSDKVPRYGYGVIKKGRSIEKVVFLYEWDSEEPEKEEAPLDSAKLIHAKIVNKEPVTNEELSTLHDNLTELILDGMKVSDSALVLIKEMLTAKS